ncbi:MAG: Gfo/Idh/MocA family oxidoreductase [Acetobacteraceae bacterium]|nr:Gfo/Idh/MocA family oxidoreductase [Acetobacteraceae bacterium]
MTPVRLGLIGCGNIARTAHLPALARLAPRVVLRAAADLNLEAATAAAKQWDATAHADYREMIERPDIDAVLIATPEYMHEEQVVTAAQAGKHVLCEKPMCRSLEEADRMLDACRRAGIVFLVGHSRRFTRRYMEVRRALDEGTIGEVRLARENERRGTTHMARMGQAGTRWTPRHWTGDPARAMGVALSHGIHEVDLLRWFLGAEPVSAYAEHEVTTPGNVGVPDFITFALRFANGALAAGEISYNLPGTYPAYHQLELFGTTGAIRARDHDMAGLTMYGPEGATFPGNYEALLHNLPAYARQLGEFVDAIEGWRPTRMPPEEARAALACALALIESARTGREVEIAQA